MDTISKIWRGDAGLARTYWGFGVLGGLLWAIPLSIVTPGSFVALFMVAAMFSYIIIVNVGTWRAASRYQGPKTWATLAKIAVAAIPVCLVIGTLAAVIIPALHGSNTAPQKAASNYLDIFDEEKAVSVVEQTQEDWQSRVARLTKSVKTGEIAVIGIKPNGQVADAKMWPVKDVDMLESSQTWWIEGDSVFINVNNTTRRNLEVLEFRYVADRCENAPNGFGTPYYVQLQQPVIGNAIISFSASDVIKRQDGCLTIFGARG